jgi:hypothetical protein
MEMVLPSSNTRIAQPVAISTTATENEKTMHLKRKERWKFWEFERSSLLLVLTVLSEFSLK